MKKSKAYRRAQRKRVICRKIHILKKSGGEQYVKAWSRGGETGRLAKGKIHCSCWMCRRKSYDELTHTDRKKLLSGKQQIDDIYIDENN
jgi:hypothetical protein